MKSALKLSLKKLSKKQKLLTGTLLFLLILLITAAVTTSLRSTAVHWSLFKPRGCKTGRFLYMADEQFVNYLPTESLPAQVKKTLLAAKDGGEDYQLKALRYDSRSKPVFQFSSPSQNNTIGVVYGSTHFTILETQQPELELISFKQLEKIISPEKAISIARPILSCFDDYPQDLTRELNLLYYNLEEEDDPRLSWVVRAREWMYSVPFSNINHFVVIDANSGRVLAHH